MDILLAGFTLWGVTLGLFWKVEDVTSAGAKRALTSWLERLDVGASAKRWPDLFIEMFDRIFGDRHFTLKCFVRSSLASLATVALLTILTIAARPQQMTRLAEEVLSDPLLPLFIFGMIATLNLVPDYLSLLESRYVIAWIGKTHAIAARVPLLILDVIVSLLVSFVAVTIFTAIAVPSANLDRLFAHWVLPYLRAGLALRQVEQDVPTLGIFLYSTLFTSAWVWLYFLSGLAVRASSGFQRLLSHTRWLFDIESHPLRSMGLVAGGIACAGYWFTVTVLRALGA